MNFKQFFKESRVSIPHIFSPKIDTKNEAIRETFTFEELIQFRDALKGVDGVITNQNANITEKIDGVSLVFGIDTAGKFFIEHSYSKQPAYSGEEIFNNIKREPTNAMFRDVFNILEQEFSKKLQGILTDNDITSQGVRIQCEWLHTPTAQVEDDTIKFVSIKYNKSKITHRDTICIIAITDFYGSPVESSLFTHFIKDLKGEYSDDLFVTTTDASSSGITFEIHLEQELDEIDKFIEEHLDEYQLGVDVKDLTDATDIKSLKSNRRIITAKLKNTSVDGYLGATRRIYYKLLTVLKTVTMFGETEGYVIKLPIPGTTDHFMCKVVNGVFHTNKGHAVELPL